MISKDGNELPAESGTSQGGVLSPLLANIFLHIAFEKWMDKEHQEKPFERYAHGIVVHYKTGKLGSTCGR